VLCSSDDLAAAGDAAHCVRSSARVSTSPHLSGSHIPLCIHTAREVSMARYVAGRTLQSERLPKQAQSKPEKELVQNASIAIGGPSLPSQASVGQPLSGVARSPNSLLVRRNSGWCQCDCGRAEEGGRIERIGRRHVARQPRVGSETYKTKGRTMEEGSTQSGDAGPNTKLWRREEGIRMDSAIPLLAPLRPRLLSGYWNARIK